MSSPDAASGEAIVVTRRVTLEIDQEEAEALLTLLLQAAEQPRASSVIADRLLVLVAEAQRALDRAEASGAGG